MALASISHSLAIPVKRFDRVPVSYLSQEEVSAVLNAPDRSSWSGHRDAVMLATMYNTGARVSEIIRLNVEDLQLGPIATLRIHGKGRKERIVPLWKETRRQLADWLRQISTAGGDPLFPSRRKERLTRAGFRSRLNTAVAIARQSCSSLRKRRVFPHLIRHNTETLITLRAFNARGFSTDFQALGFRIIGTGLRACRGLLSAHRFLRNSSNGSGGR